MTPSEIMTVLIQFHSSHHRTFKAYYCEHVCVYLASEFPGLPSYPRFVEWMPRTLIPLTLYLVSLFGACSGVSFCDSTPYPHARMQGGLHPETRAVDLRHLAGDPVDAVRLALALNPSTPEAALETLLEHGYRWGGARALISPTSKTKTPGVHLVAAEGNKPERLFCYHTADPLYRSDRKYCDAFDVFTLLEFEGNVGASLKAARLRLR
jgi:hypothetical protein